MKNLSLQDLLNAKGGPVKLLRNSRLRPESSAPYISEHYLNGPVKPEEFSDWAKEQRGWHETAVLFDLTHHMSQIHISGPNAKGLIGHLAINNPNGFYPGRCSQMSMCSADGYSITDGILYCLGDNEFEFVGPNLGVDWIQFNGETGKFDVKLIRDDRAPSYPDGAAFTRRHYRFQIQGPNAVQIIERMTGKPFPDVKFFHYTNIEIAGHKATALRHGMAGAAGLEVFGPWQDREEVRRVIIDVGRDFGMCLVGTRAYFTNPVESGWMPTFVPAIYTRDTMQAFRNWLPATKPDSLYSLEGSYYSENIEDYYITPYDLGYDKLINFDHDFIGKDALGKIDPQSRRKKATLAWNGEDVVKVLASMFERNDKKIKTLDLPTIGRTLVTTRTCDKIMRRGEMAGISFLAGYISTERLILSLALVDRNVEIGDELVILWGEAGSFNDVGLEPTEMFEIRATVTPTPYDAYAREKYRS